MLLRTFHDFAELAPYYDAWRGILDGTGSDNPYLTPEWLELWWEHYGRGRQPLVLMLEDGGAPVGFCALMVERGRLAARVRFMGHPQAGRTGIVAQPSYEEPFARLIVGYLADMKGRAIVTLRGLNHGDAASGYILAALEGRPQCVRTLPSRVIHLARTDANAYFQTRRKHHTVNKTFSFERTLAKLCDLRFERVGPGEAGVIYALHDKRWSRRLDGNGFARGASREFFQQLACEDGKAPWRTFVYLLKAGERPIGFVYCIECRGNAVIYRIAHDDDYAIFKPGMILIKRLLETFFAMGIRRADFSTGDEPYKAFWTDDTERVDSVTFANGSAVATVLVLADRAAHGLRMLLKRSAALTRFRRDTLGRLKHFLTGAPIREFVRRARAFIRQRGLMRLPGFALDRLATRLGAGRVRVSAAASGPSARYAGVTMRAAGIEEAVALSRLVCLPAGAITRRYYRGHRCLLLSRAGGVIGYAWATEQALEIGRRTVWKPEAGRGCCIYDVCIFRKWSALIDDALMCLAAQPRPRGSRPPAIALWASDRALIHAAQRLFSKQEVAVRPAATPRRAATVPQEGDAQ